MKARRRVEVTTTIELSANEVAALVAEIDQNKTPSQSAIGRLRSMLEAQSYDESPMVLTDEMMLPSENNTILVNVPFEDDYGQALVAEAERKREPTPEQVAEAELMRQRYPDAIGAAVEL